MFDWKNSTVLELAEHISVVSSALVASQLKQYESKKDQHMLDKIYAARKLAVAVRLQKKIEKTMEEFKECVGNQQTTLSIRELEEGESKRFATVEDLMADLNSED